MHRFFIDPGALPTAPGQRLPIPDAISHQVRRVLRLRDGERLALLGGDGDEIVCMVDGDALRMIERRRASGEPRHRLTVCQALLKGDGLEQVVEHGTEVGIAAFQLFVSRRCVVRDLPEHRVHRLRSIAREAAEQSGRGVIPSIHVPRPMHAILERDAVVLYEAADGVRLSELAPPHTLVVGPEGGFEPNEIEAARDTGARIASLGNRILRSETVALAAAAVVLSLSGDFA